MFPTTALVTGAANGLGAACVERLLATGTRVAALDCNEAGLKALAGAHERGRVVIIVADLSEPEDCARAAAEAVEALGPVSAFLHFAALWTGARWEEFDAEEWRRILDVNVIGTFLLTQAMGLHMKANGGGSIVLTGSDSTKTGSVSGASGAAYVASKGAVLALTRSFAKALGLHGVRVNALNPGVVNTPMASSLSEAIRAGAISQTPLGRLAEPDDIASVACFLASDLARFVTGEVVEVNGGFYFD